MHATTYGYDIAGDLASVTDADSHTITYEYDGRGQLRDVVLPARSGVDTDPVTAWTYTYDPDGNLLTRPTPSATPGRRPTTTSTAWRRKRAIPTAPTRRPRTTATTSMAT